MTDRCRNCGRDHTGPLCWAAAAAAQFQPRQPTGLRWEISALIRDLRAALRWTHRSDG